MCVCVCVCVKAWFIRCASVGTFRIKLHNRICGTILPRGREKHTQSLPVKLEGEKMAKHPCYHFAHHRSGRK